MNRGQDCITDFKAIKDSSGIWFGDVIHYYFPGILVM
jgi:hypothetical protein